MTTTVTVHAQHTDGKEVHIAITNCAALVSSVTLQDGESANCVVYDGHKITVREVDKAHG